MTKLPLDHSKLYELARKTSLLGDLVPHITTQMAVETEMHESFPRTDKDGVDTRIIIHYTNEQGNGMAIQVPDRQRLDKPFDIDGFLSGYEQHLSDTALPDDPIDRIKILLKLALTNTLASVVGIERDADSRTKVLNITVLQALTAILYNDAADVMILCRYKGGEVPSVDINHIWALTAR